MLNITQEFLDDCKAFRFHPLYTEDTGMLADEQRFNWWIHVGSGRKRPAVWVNAARDDKPIPRATAEALIAATTAQDGGAVLPDGRIADLDDDMNLIPRS
jgi:hypothetical protein